MEAPHNADFERRVLGYILKHTDEREALCSRLSPNDFYDPDHALLFTLMVQKVQSGEFFDAVLLASDLTKDGENGLRNDPVALLGATLTAASSMTRVAADEYVKRIQGLTNARTLIQVGISLSASGQEAGDDQEAINEALMQADTALRETTDKVTEASWTSLSDAVKEYEPAKSLQPLFPTGFYDLDKILQGGLRSGQVVVVAGRPASGKSTLACQISRFASMNKGVPGLLISLEMSRDEIVMRSLAAEGMIAIENLQRDNLDERDHDTLDSLRERIGGDRRPPLYIIEALAPELPAIRAEIVAAHRRVGVKYVVVDYLQLVTKDGIQTSSREVTVANISRSMKELAMKLGIAIIVVAQLNRNPEGRTSKRPLVSDLRESGQIEQDADVILLLHRPETYDQEVRPGEADLIVGKNRNGRTGDVPLFFKGAYSRFDNMAEDDYVSPES